MKRLVVLFVLALVLVAMPVSARSNGLRIRGVLGDANEDGLVNSTDVTVILSVDAGMDVPARWCPMNCGDVNGDGLVNSTDALIIINYDGGLSVPFPVGANWCPDGVQPPLGCIVQ